MDGQSYTANPNFDENSMVMDTEQTGIVEASQQESCFEGYTYVTIPRRHLPILLQVLELFDIPHRPGLNVPEVTGWVSLHDPFSPPPPHPEPTPQLAPPDQNFYLGQGTPSSVLLDNTAWHPQPADTQPLIPYSLQHTPIDEPPPVSLGPMYPQPQPWAMNPPQAITPPFPPLHPTHPLPSLGVSPSHFVDQVPVPQRPYRAARGSLEQLSPPLEFWKDNVAGVSVSELLGPNPPKLDHGDMQVFCDCGESVSIRINWPKISKWTEQFATLNHKRERQPITLNKAAVLVARKIERFFNWARTQMEEARTPTESCEWKLGDNWIRLEDLVLLALRRVSRGSWQPEIMVRWPFGCPARE